MNMTKKNIGYALAGLSLLGSCTAGKEKAPDRPNIVFILVDDMGWTDLGCYGSRFYETPNIDRLAGEGFRFTDAYAACPVCSPTRASILTGQYPARLHLTDYLPGRRNLECQPLLKADIVPHLPFANVTIAEALRQYGYNTAMIGKWHLGDSISYPEKHGFNINIGGYEKGYPPSYFFPYTREGKGNPRIPTLHGGKEGEYLTDRLTNEAIKYITDNKDRPFFLYLAHYAVHDPVQSKEDKIEKYKAKLANMPVPDGPPYILEGNPARPGGPFTEEEKDSMMRLPEFKGFGYFPHRLTKIRQHQDNPVFAGMVESVDESVGEIMETLDKLGLEKNTIVFLFSDNGGMSSPDAASTSNLPLRGGKGWLYEGGIREPLIIRWPGKIEAGTVSHVPVISTDFYPTILHLAGFPLLPDEHKDGVSLAPLLLKGEAPVRDALFWHWPHYSNHGQQSPASVIRKGDYKLIEYHENGYVQLFNLKDDIGEHHNLAREMPGKVNELRDELHRWEADTKVGRTKPNPDYHPNPQNVFKRW